MVAYVGNTSPPEVEPLESVQDWHQLLAFEASQSHGRVYLRKKKKKSTEKQKTPKQKETGMYI